MSLEEIREKNKYKSPMDQMGIIAGELAKSDYSNFYFTQTKRYKKINVDKIKDLEDIKRIIAALNIEFELTGDTYNKGYELVKDLCD